MTASKITHFWMPAWADAILSRFREEQKMKTRTAALLNLLRYGDQYYSLITNQDEITCTDHAMRTLADSLTEQQLAYLLKIAIEKLGLEELDRINRLVARK